MCNFNVGVDFFGNFSGGMAPRPDMGRGYRYGASPKTTPLICPTAALPVRFY